MAPAILFPFLLLLSLAPLPPPAKAQVCDSSDKKALLQIKQDLGNPDTLDGWGTDDSCCDWAGIGCEESGPLAGRVIAVAIGADSNLSASIPTSISLLPNLQGLAFYLLPKLTGRIPNAIATLTNLVQLILFDNMLTGPVPGFLSKLSNLNVLSLANNRLSGTIPPSLGNLKNINLIDLSGNNLTGSIPDSFGNLPRDMIGFILSHNQLSGPVPSSLGAINYYWLNFSHNSLEGDASFLLGPAAKSHSLIDLSMNRFDFDLTGVDITTANLTYLDLSHNRIRGKIPQVLTRAELLLHLNVSYNQLCGEIPQGGNLQQFDQDAFAQNKCLCGAPLQPCN